MHHNHNFFFLFVEPASTRRRCKTTTGSHVRYHFNFTVNFLFYGFLSEKLLTVFSKEYELSFKT